MTAATRDALGPAANAAGGAEAEQRKESWLDRLHWTIGRRLILAMLVTVTLGVIALTTALVSAERDRAIAQAAQDSLLFHKLMATEGAAAVHFRELPAIQRRLATFVKAFGDTLLRLETFDKEGNQLYVFSAADSEAMSLKAALTREKAQIDAGETVASSKANLVEVGSRVILGGEHVGYLLTGWSLDGVAKAHEEAIREQSLKLTLLIAGLVLLAVFATQAWMAGRYVTGPIRRITRVMNQLASGNHAVEIPGLSSKDEIGDIARATLVFRENALRTQALVEQVTQSAR